MRSFQAHLLCRKLGLVMLRSFGTVFETLLRVYLGIVEVEKFRRALVGEVMVLLSSGMSATRRFVGRSGTSLMHLSKISRLAMLSLWKPCYAVF